MSSRSRLGRSPWVTGRFAFITHAFNPLAQVRAARIGVITGPLPFIPRSPERRLRRTRSSSRWPSGRRSRSSVRTDATSRAARTVLRHPPARRTCHRRSSRDGARRPIADLLARPAQALSAVDARERLLRKLVERRGLWRRRSGARGNHQREQGRRQASRKSSRSSHDVILSAAARLRHRRPSRRMMKGTAPRVNRGSPVPGSGAVMAFSLRR